MKGKISLISIVLFLFVCNQSKAGNNYWDKIKLNFDNQEIIIWNYDNDVLFTKYHYSYSGFEATLIDQDMSTYKITEEEKKTIYNILKKIMDNPIDLKVMCSEYVGTFKIDIIYSEQLEQTCEYTSICDWRKLNQFTENLYGIFSKKIATFE